MNDTEWLANYFDHYRQVMFQPAVHSDLITLRNWILECNRRGKKIIFAGNGGSAAMASHCAVDFTKTAGIRAIDFNEADLITCFANDYGYEHWVEKALEFYSDDEDLVVLISSSGKSPNILHAAEYAKRRGLRLATFSGFSESNPLRKMGGLNFWVSSDSYNHVENTHLVWLLTVCDLVIAGRKT